MSLWTVYIKFFFFFFLLLQRTIYRQGQVRIVIENCIRTLNKYAHWRNPCQHCWCLVPSPVQPATIVSIVKEHMAQQLVAPPAFQNHFPRERRCIIHHGCWFSWGGGGALLHHNRGGWGEGSCGSQAVWTGQTVTVQLPCLPLWPRLLLDAWKADIYLLKQVFISFLSVVKCNTWKGYCYLHRND